MNAAESDTTQGIDAMKLIALSMVIDDRFRPADTQVAATAVVTTDNNRKTQKSYF